MSGRLRPDVPAGAVQAAQVLGGGVAHPAAHPRTHGGGPCRVTGEARRWPGAVVHAPPGRPALGRAPHGTGRPRPTDLATVRLQHGRPVLSPRPRLAAGATRAAVPALSGALRLVPCPGNDERSSSRSIHPEHLHRLTAEPQSPRVDSALACSVPTHDHPGLFHHIRHASIVTPFPGARDVLCTPPLG